MSDTHDAANALASAHSLLQEVLDYLQRLPVHPMTRTLSLKVQSHLADPLYAMASRQAAIQAREAEMAGITRLAQVDVSPAGVPALEIYVFGSQTVVESPMARVLGGSSDGRAFAVRLASQLRHGVVADLRQAEHHNSLSAAAKRIAGHLGSAA